MSRSNRRGFNNVKKTGFKVIKLYEDELEKVLKYDLGLDKVRKHTGRKGMNWMFCCPFHGETRPSAGIVMSDDGSMFGQCYTCEETFTLPKLYAHVKDITILEAIEELEEEYRSEIRTDIHGISKIKRYEEKLHRLLFKYYVPYNRIVYCVNEMDLRKERFLYIFTDKEDLLSVLSDVKALHIEKLPEVLK